MKFNKRLIEDIEERDQGIASIILFMIERDMNPFHFFDMDTNILCWNINIKDKVNEVTNRLMTLGKVEMSYENGRDGRLVITDNLYTNNPVNNDFIKELRSFWSFKNIGVKGMSGDNESIRRQMVLWRETYTATDEDILRAAKDYVEDTRRQGKLAYLRKLQNFIYTTEDSLLASWIDDLEQPVDNWRNKAS